MKKFITFTLLSSIVLIAFTLLLKYFTFIKTKPDIILIVVIYVAITSDRASDIFIAFALGYLFDIFSGGIIGLFALLRTITFMIALLFNMKFFSKSAFLFVIATFIISIFDSIYLGYQFSDNNFLKIVASSIYLSLINAIAALFIYPLLLKIEKITLKLASAEGV